MRFTSTKSKLKTGKTVAMFKGKLGLFVVLSLCVVLILSFTFVSDSEEVAPQTQSVDASISMFQDETEFSSATLSLESIQHYNNSVLDSIPAFSKKLPYQELKTQAEAKRTHNPAPREEGIRLSDINFGDNLNTKRASIPKTSQRIQLSQQRRSATSTVVDFRAENNSGGNPYTVNYAYEMNKASNGDTEIELKAFLAPLDMYIDENLKMTDDGQMVTMPKDLTLGQQLPDVAGTFKLQIPNVPSFDKKYEVTLSNRKIEEVATKTVNGQNHKAYKHSYYYLNKSYLNGKLDCTKYHKVTEWYVESIGLIEQQRSGTNERGEHRELIKSSSDF